MVSNVIVCGPDFISNNQRGIYQYARSLIRALSMGGHSISIITQHPHISYPEIASFQALSSLCHPNVFTRRYRPYDIRFLLFVFGLIRGQPIPNNKRFICEDDQHHLYEASFFIILVIFTNFILCTRDFRALGRSDCQSLIRA